MLSGHVDYVVGSLTGNDNVWNIQRLRVDVTIDGIGKELSELGGVDVSGGEHDFVQVLPSAAVVVVIG